MNKTPLPFHDQNLVMLMLQDHLFGCPGNEIGDNTIDRAAISFDHNARLPGGDKFGIVPAFLQAERDFDRAHHFSDTAIMADGMNAQAIFTQPFSAGDFLLAILPHVDQFYAVLGSGSGKFGIVGNKIV